MASVTLDGVKKVYGEGSRAQVAVHGVDLTVADGELVVLVGPSGCGKSTTLRMIAGLETITAGRLLIGDRPVNDVPAKERDIAMVFQSYALYPHMTAYENMAFALRMRKLPSAEVDTRVREAAAILGIEALLARRPRELSGGQRQRVAVGRAIVRKPQVFLFDEPLSNLDAKLRVQMRREIARLHAELGATMIYVTHDQVEAMTLGDRIVVMHEGRVQQIGTPLDLYDRPKNVFVAAFVGSPAMNLLEGELVRDGGVRFVASGGAFSLGPAAEWEGALGGHARRAVLLGARPESIRPGRGGPGGVKMTLDLLEPMGSEVFLYASAGDQTVTARVPPQALPHRGEAITLTVDLQSAHLFDKATGERIA